MSVLGALLRIFSYVYHLMLSGFLLGIASLALASGQHTLRLDMLPWAGRQLTWGVFGLGLFGLLSVMLAIGGKLRFVFVLWTLAALVLMLYGYFLSPYTFSGTEELNFALLLSAGALLAFLGSLTQFRKRKRF